MHRWITSSWIASLTVVAAAAIAGCNGGSGAVPSGVQSIPQGTQQSLLAPNAVPTIPPGAIVEYHIPTPHSGDEFIAAAGDGNLWFTESGKNKIGRITVSGVITEFSSVGSTPNDIRTGPDGHAWFETYGPDSIGRIGYDGSVQLFPIPSPTGHPEQLVGDRARNAIWFAESKNQAIGEFSIATQTFTEFPIPPPAGGAAVHPFAIALDRLGDVWFSDVLNNQIDEMSGNGVLMQRIDLPAPGGPLSLFPWRMTLGPDHDLWTVELTGGPNGNGAIAKVRPSTGALATYTSPSSRYGASQPFDVVAVSDGVWVAEGALSGIAHVTPYGHFKEFKIPFSGTTGVAIGSDGNLWLAEVSRNAIAKVTLSLLP